jgi:5-methylcytosine-specific restriction endonuclease McrA
MIPVKRPRRLAAFSKPDGKAVMATIALKYEFAANLSLQDGTATPNWKSDIWSAAKPSYLKAQAGKCIFCESKFAAVSYGDVEHFRPKSGYVAVKGEPLEKPGYWWLAYEWSNYWASCQRCNQEFKKNYFPIQSEQSRAKTPTDSLANEKALLPDPAKEDPRAFLEFRSEVAFARQGSPRGQACIDVAGLNRDDLLELRREVLKSLRFILTVWRQPSITPAFKTECETFLKLQLAPHMPYSAMVLDTFVFEAPELLNS